MSGRHKFSDLEAKMPRARRARIARIAETLESEIDAASARNGAFSDRGLLDTAEADETPRSDPLRPSQPAPARRGRRRVS